MTGPVPVQYIQSEDSIRCPLASLKLAPHGVRCAEWCQMVSHAESTVSCKNCWVDFCQFLWHAGASAACQCGLQSKNCRVVSLQRGVKFILLPLDACSQQPRASGSFFGPVEGTQQIGQGGPANVQHTQTRWLCIVN